MTEQEMLAKMVPPAGHRPSKPYRGGVIQIRVTRACDKACFSCTQGSQLGGRVDFMTPEQFEVAVLSMRGYWGVIGTFGGNPAVSKYFVDYCRILQKHIPKEQCGLWCNNILTEEKAKAARATYNPAYSNLNCHLDAEAHANFKRWWPESGPFGADRDSRHSPPYVSMVDIGVPEAERRELISRCNVNQFWSAGAALFRNEVRGYFCEIAAGMAAMHQDDDDWQKWDVGLDVTRHYDFRFPEWNRRNLEACSMSDPSEAIIDCDHPHVLWWQLGMPHFTHQVRQCCHHCSIPLKGHGELAMAGDEGREQVSKTHEAIFRPKRRGRRIELVTTREQLGEPLEKMTSYLSNAKK